MNPYTSASKNLLYFSLFCHEQKYLQLGFWSYSQKPN